MGLAGLYNSVTHHSRTNYAVSLPRRPSVIVPRVTDRRAWPSQSHLPCLLVFLSSGASNTRAWPPSPRITRRTLETAVEGPGRGLFSGGFRAQPAQHC